MHRALILLVIACGSSTKPAPQPQQGVPPTLSNQATRTCQHAARGLSGATRGVLEPEADVFDTLVARCDSDHWPSKAIECFAEMMEGDLGRCATELDDRQREAMFAVLAGGEPSLAGIAVAKARLQTVKVGIESCDRFVAAVSAVLGCEGLSIEMRLQLGNETAHFWSLPTDRLAADDIQRMSQVCVTSLETLAKETAPVGCGL